MDPDRSVTGNSEKELSIGPNWSFRGHHNKLTLDYSWLSVDDPVENGTRNRLRFQWELSLQRLLMLCGWVPDLAVMRVLNLVLSRCFFVVR